MGNLPSWKLTYPIQGVVWEDQLPFFIGGICLFCGNLNFQKAKFRDHLEEKNESSFQPCFEKTVLPPWKMKILTGEFSPPLPAVLR